MKNYKVTLDFKAGPSFSVELESDSLLQAKADAREMAKLNGFTDLVKSISAREVA